VRMGKPVPATEAADGKQFTRVRQRARVGVVRVGAVHASAPVAADRGISYPLKQSIDDVPRHFFPVQPPIDGHLGRRIMHGGLHIDKTAGGHQLGSGQLHTDRGNQVLTEGRVDKNDIEGAGRILQEGQGSHHMAASPRTGPERLHMVFDLAQGWRRAINEITTGGATGQGLEAQRAAAGEKIEAAGAMNRGRQPVEQGFAHSIGGRSQSLGGRERQFTPAPLPPNDAQGTLFCRPLFY